MRRCVLLCLTLITMSACQGSDATMPTLGPASGSDRSISDGSRPLGNPDFFFLPPMVKNPSADLDWSPGGFNGALTPVVKICAMSGTTEATAALTAQWPC